MVGEALGSVFRGILLGAKLPEDHDLAKEFYQTQHFANVTVFDPFMGSGTTIGEAHKLGLTAIGRDINPVAVEAVRTALGPMDKDSLKRRLSGLIARRGRTNPRTLPIEGLEGFALRRTLFLLGHAGAVPPMPHPRRSFPILGHRTERLPQPEAGSPDPLPLVRRHLSGLSWPMGSSRW